MSAVCLFACSQLKTIAPNHLIVKKTAEAEEAFTNAASGFAG